VFDYILLISIIAMKNFITDTIKCNAPPWDLINTMMSGIPIQISAQDKKRRRTVAADTRRQKRLETT
jgi:hypothetical protein